MSEARIKALYTASLAIIDGLMTGIAFVIAYRLRVAIPFPSQGIFVQRFLAYVPMLAVQVFAVLVVFYFNRLYHIRRASSRMDQFYVIFGAVSVGTMMAVAISSLTLKNSVFELDYPRAMVLYAWLFGIALVTLGREAHRGVWNTLRRRGIGRDRVVLVGRGDALHAIIQKIRHSPQLGYELLGVVSPNGEADDAVVGVPTIGRAEDLPELIDTHDVDEIIIAMPEGSRRKEITHLVSLCQRGQVSIKIFPDVFEFITTGVSIDDLGGLPLLNVRDIQLRGWKLSLKRGLDIVGASMGLVMLSPVMLFTALLVRLESPGSAFYSQERMGLDGKPFQMVKFRSMRSDAEDEGPGWTTKDDPRRTKLGAWLRSKNIDELPQLVNVLVGEMSLVGPRPERPVYVQRFRQSIPRYMERHREKAGMAGWAQINGLRGDTSIAERTKYDLWYVENWSLWLDMRIILRTIAQVVFDGDKNAY
jgi:exopolysaccharide biosynthesis polyprenyl glycosylphosphotransferase